MSKGKELERQREPMRWGERSNQGWTEAMVQQGEREKDRESESYRETCAERRSTRGRPRCNTRKARIRDKGQRHKEMRNTTYMAKRTAMARVLGKQRR